MTEHTGNIFTSGADWICITTNGSLRKNRFGIMGAGVALQAAKRWPDLPQELGKSLLHNHVSVTPLKTLDNGQVIFALPVKFRYYERANMMLIETSLHALRRLALVTPGVRRVALPRPGYGAGGLQWEDVKPVVQTALPDDTWLMFEVWQI